MKCMVYDTMANMKKLSMCVTYRNNQRNTLVRFYLFMRMQNEYMCVQMYLYMYIYILRSIHKYICIYMYVYRKHIYMYI
jgi:hypothetical protein